ncbi:hypothetical protein SSYRP_v1c06270 [Spiroplasma syrphidicola EA-1]|uniref:AB hydrolase-1 domain-containing protein n=1 Tax=Spiroplasma syrphidicola EA-1 TaxID=1276229 RepID=R4U450_9MOLU|nr:alpha/beta fold hydrolase [Spiroplasma syrphidicola]AGM26217.1 hypothetical protein SSYRP_v1c06270 [Spiroplasma syrphidicola EA-1]
MKKPKILPMLKFNNSKTKQYNNIPGLYKIVAPDQIEEYLAANKIYIKMFYAIQDRRMLLTHSTWWKKGYDLEGYCKKYLVDLTTRLKIKAMMPTASELATKWDINEYDVPGYQDAMLKTITIKSWVKNDNNDKWVVVVHGLNSHKFRSIFFGLIYLRQGYNIVVFDQRNHGQSTGEITTMSNFEKHDLECIVNFLKALPATKISEINFHGWSMGTFVIVEYLKMISEKQELVGWAVLDSTVNRLSELYYYYMNNLKINYYEHYYAIKLYAEQQRGYDPEEINPGENLDLVAKIPFLYILNQKDHATPYQMGNQAFYNKKGFEKTNLSRKVLFNCDHVRGIHYDPVNYLNEINLFITNCDNKKRK